MSGQLWGQDIEQVRELSRKFETSAQNLESARQLIDGVVFGFDGWGPNVDQMRDMWSGDLAPSLTQIADALRGAGDKAAQNADDQQETTDSYDGSAFAGATASGSAQVEDPFAGVTAEASGEADGGGVLGWFGDRLDDVGDGMDWIGDQASDLGGWFSDTASDAGDWLSDRASDVGDWASDTASNFGDSFGNLWDAGGQLWDATGGSILDGRWPRTTEVIASSVLFGGAAVDTAITQATLGQVDLNIFDDGEPWAGEPQPIEPERNLNSIGDLAHTVSDSYDAGDGVVRVTTLDTPEGPRVVVSVPGTESWSPAGDNPMDLTGNLVTAGGGTSTMTQAVELAMQNADIPPDAQVMLVGHSQGGMTVADLVSDSDFVSEYNVTNAMTVGSPIDSANIDSRVDVLEAQHGSDVVPRLDMGDGLYNPVAPLLPIPSGTEQAGPGHTEVTLDNPESTPWYDALGNHDHREYGTSLDNSSDPGVIAYEQQLRDSGFLSPINPETGAPHPPDASAVDVSVERRQ